MRDASLFMPVSASLFSLVLAVSFVGCGGDDEPGTDGGGGGMDSGGRTDGGTGVDGGTTDDGGTGVDGGATDDGGAIDDGGAADDGGASDVDGGPACGPTTPGACASSLECLSCPRSGIVDNYLCTTMCTSDTDCTDAARPHCNRPMVSGSGSGICTTNMFVCVWGAICAAPDTPILTPDGERPIAELRVGDLVMSMHEGELRAVPIARVGSQQVVGHAVVEAHLANGRTLHISGGHPTADGRLFADLAPGDDLGGAAILEVATIPYDHDATYDILPASDTGTYVAAGALIGSTLR